MKVITAKTRVITAKVGMIRAASGVSRFWGGKIIAVRPASITHTTLLQLVAEMLRKCHGETGIMDFGLKSRLASWSRPSVSVRYRRPCLGLIGSNVTSN